MDIVPAEGKCKQPSDSAEFLIALDTFLLHKLLSVYSEVERLTAM